jgi:hypothetical protein
MPNEIQQKPTVGRIVHYRLRSTGEIRPGLIVRVWNDDCVQLKVFLDEANDTNGEETFASSCMFGTLYGQWQWPTRS